jgi:hypothetical protein
MIDIIKAILPFIFSRKPNPLSLENSSLKEKIKDQKSLIKYLVIAVCVTGILSLFSTIILVEVLLHTLIED